MKKLYAVYDRVSDFWQPPVIANNDNEAARGFILSCCSPAIPESFLGDISLNFIGEYDETTGDLHQNCKRMVIRGDDIVVKRFRAESNCEVDNNEISEEEDEN